MSRARQGGSSVTGTGDITVTAVFARMQYNLNVAVVGQGQVTQALVVPDRSSSYEYESVVRLTAVPDAGWEFTRWEGDLTGSDNPTTLVMDSDKNVTAVFTPTVAYTITTSTYGNGTIELDPDQATYSYGDEVQVEAVPNAGWELYVWSGDLSGNVNPTTLTVTGDMSIGAEFVSDDYLGLGLGARCEYEYEFTGGSYPYEHSGWAAEEAVERFNHNGLRMYKVQAYTDLQMSDPPSGFFRGRSGDTHYDFGTWSDGPGMPSESWYDEPKVIVTKPVQVGAVGFTDMEAARQESVAVDAGTYDAWVFHRESDSNGRSIETDIWFVPYLGVVKSYEVITRIDPDTGDEITDVYSVELVSYTPGTL